MYRVPLLLFVLVAASLLPAQIGEGDAARVAMVCAVATEQLRSSAPEAIELEAEIDESGHIGKFKTIYPALVRLERSKEAREAIRAMTFPTATRQGVPVKVKTTVTLDCRAPRRN